MLDPCKGAAPVAAPEPSACAGPAGDHAEARETLFWVDPVRDADNDVGLAFGLVPAPDASRRRCRNALIGSLYTAVRNGGSGIFYSRDRNWYPDNRHLLPPFITYRSVRWAVCTMEAAPRYFVSRRVAPARPEEGLPRRRSSLHPGPGFLEVANALKVLGQPLPPVQYVLLRDRQRRTMAYSATTQTTRTEALLRRYNEMLARCTITRASAATDSEEQHRIEPRPIVAIFNDADFRRGGRLYCGPWMNLSKAERAALRIDGEPVVELDYPGCHLRLLLAAAGEDRLARDLSFDPYAIAGFDRGTVKLGIHILLNAADAHEAVGALQLRLAELGIATAQQTAADVIDAVQRTLPMLAPVWSTGIGIELMNVDANMCLSVIGRLMDQGIVVLTVHDSFIVPARHEAALQQAMDDAFEIGLCEAQRRFGPRLRIAGHYGNSLTSTAPSHPPPVPRSPSVPRRLLQARAARMLDELERLLVADPRPLRSRICLAALLIGTVYPFAENLAERTRTVLERAVRDHGGGAVSSLDVDRIVAEVNGRGDFRVTNSGAARLAAAPAHIADEIGLDLLRPRAGKRLSRKERSNLKRRLRRQARRKSPRIVDLARARPWELEGMSRSAWYAQHRDGRERQLLGLHALLIRGDLGAVARVRREVALRLQTSKAEFLRDMRQLLDRHRPGMGAAEETPGAKAELTPACPA
jgi:hypothetical protein